MSAAEQMHQAIEGLKVDKRRRGVFRQTEFIGEAKKERNPEADRVAWSAYERRCLDMACGRPVK
jgi:hypothetical protein